MGIRHAKVSAVTDNAVAALVQPSDWNADHVIETDPLVTDNSIARWDTVEGLVGSDWIINDNGELSSEANNLSTVGDATLGSATEQIFRIFATIPVTASLADYEKVGMYVDIDTNDPSDATTRDCVACDFRTGVGAGNTNARIWGIFLQNRIPAGTDATTWGIEYVSTNNASDVPGVGSTLAKKGFTMAAAGAVDSTVAFLLTSGGAKWHYGLWANSDAIRDDFLHYVNNFIVSGTGIVQLLTSAEQYIDFDKDTGHSFLGADNVGTTYLYTAGATDVLTLGAGNVSDWLTINPDGTTDLSAAPVATAVTLRLVAAADAEQSIDFRDTGRNKHNYIGCNRTAQKNYFQATGDYQWDFYTNNVLRTTIYNGNITTTVSYSIAGTKVIGARDTGWTAMTGTPDEITSYATGTITLAQLAGRVMALQTALTTHGLIGT